MVAKRISGGVLVAVAIGAPMILWSSPAIARPQRPTRPTRAAATVRPNVLLAVDGTSSSNAWAVGDTTVGPVTRTLIEHWNGRSWRIQRSRNPGKRGDSLTGVAAVSPTDAWAVGTALVSGNSEGLIEHWNGTAWSVQSGAQVPGALLNLSAVSAISATNIWAVGSLGATGTTVRQTFIEHWNGVAWSRVASPNASTNTNFLAGVAAIPGHAWTVGAAFEDNSNLQNPLVEQSTGTGWSVQACQSPGAAPQDTLAAVSATASGTAWAVGSFLNGRKVSRSLIEQAGPTGWTIESSPNRGPHNNFLTAVAATSATNAWAAGQSDSGGIKTLVERWSGNTWAIQKTPNEGTEFSVLQGLDATSTTNAWAVGDFGGSGGDPQTLIEHWDGSAWKTQKSPNR